MKITNKSNLPLPLVKAIELDPYGHDCDFSTTTLIKPPRIVALERAHADELEEDAADRIWALIGQIGHLILERASVPGEELVERRFTARVCGKTIGGQVDLWNRGTLTLLDYKFTSIWSATHGVKPEWEQQMNINAFLCAENGLTVTKAQIVCIFRDWSVGEARRSQGYPQQQVRVLDVPLWPPEHQLAYIADRVQKQLNASQTLPECSAVERWAKPEKWAVMAPGRKRAVLLCDTLKEAKERADTGAGHYVQHRPGVNTRCEDFCAVAQFCEQFKKLKEL